MQGKTYKTVLLISLQFSLFTFHLSSFSFHFSPALQQEIFSYSLVIL